MILCGRLRDIPIPILARCRRQRALRCTSLVDKPLISDRAIQIVAENKIRTALDAGEFDNLPGFGKPSPLIDEPYDPNWWIRRKLQREQIQIRG